MSQKGKWEYFRAIHGRYHRADRKSKQVILNECCITTGYNRKDALRLLHGPIAPLDAMGAETLPPHARHRAPTELH